MATTQLSDKRIMITGGTAGLGRAAAMLLAEMGAQIFLVCRNREKGEAVASEIQERTGRADTEILVGDMNCQHDIREIAKSFLAKGHQLDVLFNNAGVVMQERTLTPDGFETTFGVNHLGYFLLTVLLVDSLRASPCARVVNTASDAYKFSGGRLDFDNLQGEQRYSTFGAYGASKLANILFTRELAHRLRSTSVTCNAFHPGMVASDFAKNNGWFARTAMALIKPIARSPSKGAETGVYLCSSPEVEGQTGGYYYDCKIRTPRTAATNAEDAARLWAVSEELTGAAPMDLGSHQ